jgi:DNA modification methylase
VSHVRVLVGDVRERLADLEPESVQTIVTSPPYWQLRDYGHPQQTGLEPSPRAFVEELVSIFRLARRALRKDGTLWVNLGDTYGGSRKGSTGKTSKLTNPKRYELAKVPHVAKDGKRRTGLKRKDLAGIPWRFAFAMQDDGWYLRSEIIWHKPCAMPESVLDRPSREHEHVFLLSRSRNYFYDVDATRTPQKSRSERHEGKSGYADGHPSKGGIKKRALHPLGANLRTIWTITPTQYRGGEHYSTFPIELPTRCILAGSRPGDTVLDIFAGTGTTLEAAIRQRRHAIGIELVPSTAEQIDERLRGLQLPLLA